MSRTPSIEIQIGHVLESYNKEFADLVYRAAKQAAHETKRMLKNTSPGKGDYAKGWAIKKGKGSYIVYNKTHPGLTHLLEDSHVIKNQFGTYGRTEPGKGQVIHIKPAEEFGIDRFLELIEEAGMI